LLVAVLVIPVWNAIKTGGPVEWPPRQAVKEALAEVRFRAQEAAAQGEVLFIDQRQLLTFGYIEDVPLVMDYELKHMMNQAMGRNKDYFARFESDLARHRFSLIISDPLPVVYKRGEGPFPEENDLWVDQVTLPILRYYEPTVKIPEFDIWLLVPKQQVGAGEGD
jgi:sulfur carrier protein ThiS